MLGAKVTLANKKLPLCLLRKLRYGPNKSRLIVLFKVCMQVLNCLSDGCFQHNVLLKVMVKELTNSQSE